MSSAETRRLEEMLGRVGRELDELVSTPWVDPVRHRAEWSELLSGGLPEQGAGADVAMDRLSEMIPYGTRNSDPRFWAFVSSAPTTVPVAAFAAGMVASPQRYTITAFNRMEELSLEWMAELFGLSPEMKGLYSSGGSTASIVGLGAARQWAYERIGVDVGAEGIGRRRGAIYTSSEAHHTVQRAAGVLGIGRQWVRSIPVDERQRINIDLLRDAISGDVANDVLPIAVVGSAGTTNTGAVDPLRAMGEIARDFDTWFHVDGAYGLPGIVDQSVSQLFDGLELADSVIVDPHKWLGAPVGIGVTYVRDRSILYRGFTQEPATYLEKTFGNADDVEVSIDHMGIDYADFGVELSSPSRGVAVWALLIEQGREGVKTRVATDINRARLVTRLAKEHPRLESLIEPDLSVACFRYSAVDPADVDEFNAVLLRRIVRETAFTPSATVVNGAFAIRPCFMTARATDEMAVDLVETVVRLGDEMTSTKHRTD